MKGLGSTLALAVLGALGGILIVLSSGLLGHRSGPPEVSISNTEVHSLGSSFADQEYRLLVALPQGYAQSEQRYPVLYVLDADAFFGTITETARLLPLENFFLGHRMVPSLIVVGLAYPGGPAEMIEKRGRDFTPTTEYAEDHGDPQSEPDGATLFFRFLKEQAIPFVDQTYRTRPGDRGLIGTSAAGIFILDTLLRHPGTFHRYIATSPRMDEIIFRHEAAFAEQDQDLSAILYLSTGTEGEIEQQIAAGVERFHAQLSGRQHPGLQMILESFEGESHVSAQPTAFTRGLKATYGRKRTGARANQPSDR